MKLREVAIQYDHELLELVGVVQLTRGKVAKIDLEDVEEVSKYNWFATKQGYVLRNDSEGMMRLHRLINKTPEGLYTDHINRDTLDNRRCNLRNCTASQNVANTRSQRQSFSRYKGVGYLKKEEKWYSQIKIHGKKKFLGYFDSEFGAAKCYDVHAVQLFGEFAKPNFRSCL